ncbi:hypothetical protein [Acetivibrio saccincola]|nr:hypothetical protein [Acetivibrio saccincola]HOA97579.1 hypothetical protein [Acetivibrio saccincola]HQD28803.1 hypothetical protein [Acetivibrio saccincola]
MNKFHDGSLKLFFSTFLKKEKLTDDEIIAAVIILKNSVQFL